MKRFCIAGTKNNSVKRVRLDHGKKLSYGNSTHSLICATALPP
ncbi:MAG: hypothetical protein ACK57R_07075 [Dolichospermum sp.]|jgi:hypothetical protein